MARYPYYRPGLPTCYIDDSCVVKTQEEVDAIERSFAQHYVEGLWNRFVRGELTEPPKPIDPTSKDA